MAIAAIKDDVEYTDKTTDENVVGEKNEGCKIQNYTQ